MGHPYSPIRLNLELSFALIWSSFDHSWFLWHFFWHISSLKDYFKKKYSQFWAICSSCKTSYNFLCQTHVTTLFGDWVDLCLWEVGWLMLGVTVEETVSSGWNLCTCGCNQHWLVALCILMFISTALNTAFGSLYCDEVMVSPVKVVPLLAAANLLQLVSTIWNPRNSWSPKSCQHQ